MPSFSRACRTRLPLPLLIAATALLVGAAPASATTFTVLNGGDSGADTLRQAVLDANAAPGADTIDFAPAVTTITLTTGEIEITDDATIEDTDGTPVTISGNDASRIFYIPSADLTLSNLHLTRGLVSSPGGSALGGAVFQEDGALTIENSELDLNRVEGDSAFGGALAVTDMTTVTILDSSFHDNEADAQVQAYGGAILFSLDISPTLDGLDVRDNLATSADNSYGGGLSLTGTASFSVDHSEIVDNRNVGANTVNGGGIQAVTPLTVTNSTIAGNSVDGGAGAGAFGGGIHSIQSLTSSNSTLQGNTLIGVTERGAAAYVDGAASGTLTHVTISGNSGATSSGIEGPVDLDHVIVVENTGGAQCVGTTSLGHNLVPVGGCPSPDPTDIETTTARLAPLANNGGATLTMLPRPWSLAVDGGQAGPCASATDQRGTARPIGSACDIGAVEAPLPGSASAPTTSAAGDRDIAAGASAGQAVTFTNLGPGPIGGPTQPSQVALTGTNTADFSITSDTCSGVDIAAAASCALTVRFDPSDVGLRTANLAVTFSSGTLNVALTGTGTTPPPACPNKSVTTTPGATLKVNLACGNDATAYELLDSAPSGWSVSISAGVATFVSPKTRLDPISVRYRASNKGGASPETTLTVTVERVTPLAATLRTGSYAMVQGKPLTGRCSVDLGDLRRCQLIVRSGKTIIARQTVNVTGRRTFVALRTTLNATGKRLLKQQIGGIRAKATITVRTADGDTDSTVKAIRLVPVRQVVLPPRSEAYFGNSALPTAGGKAFLATLAKQLKGAPLDHITCVGHSAAFKTDLGSSALGKARARHACDTLRSKGIRTKFLLNGKDASYAPRAGNENEFQRGLNRRVDIIVVYR